MMRGFKYAGFAAVLAGTLYGTVVASDTPGAKFGGEFNIDGAATGVQGDPAVAGNAAGGIVVAWQDFTAAPSTVLVRRYSVMGTPFTEPAVIGAGADPAVAMSSGSGFVIAYKRDQVLRFALFGDDGAPIKDVPVDSDPTASTPHPAVAMSADGVFVTAYFKTVASTKSVVARRFDAAGNQLGLDIVAPLNGTRCDTPVVAMSAGGGFVVACIVTQTNVKQVQAQVYDSAGLAVGTPIKANALDAPDLANLRAAMDGTGNFVLVWSLGTSQITGRFFNANSTPASTEVVVATSTSTGLELGGVAMSALGATVITWDTRGQGNTQTGGSDVFERRFDANHQPVEIRQVNSTTPRPHAHQFSPSVALDADGDFVVVWQDGDAAETNVLGQRFVGPENVNLSLDIEDNPDPAVGDQQVTYLFKVSNLHAVVTPIAGASAGIARVNQAIGSAHNVELTATIPGTGAIVQGGSADWAACQPTATPSTVRCVYTGILGPGENRTVTLRRAAPTVGGTDSATGTVTAYQFDATPANNTDTETTNLPGNPPTVRFATATSSALENAGVRHVTVTLSEPATQEVTVAFTATSASTATASTTTTPGDYTLSPSPLHIPVGQSSADILVSIVNDTVPEEDETVVLELSSPSHAVLTSPTTHTLTIQDNEPPIVRFHQAAEEANESAGPVEIQVDLSHVSTSATTVTFTVTGTATPTSDFTATPNGTLTIPAGQQHGTITITPVNDTADEFDETVVLTLTAVTNGSLGTPVQNTLTLHDDDAPGTLPTVQFTSGSAADSESGANVVATVALSAVTTVPVTVQFSVGGDADNNDFAVTSPATNTLTIAPGQLTATITIDVTDDAFVEPNETVVLTLANPSNATLGGQKTFTLTILDDDGGPGTNRVTVDSAAADKQVTFEVDRGRFNTVSLATTPGNPPAGLDYPLGFFVYSIGAVAPGAIVTLTVTVPEGSNITDWIDCTENSCYRYPQNDTPDPGQARVEGDRIVVRIQDNGPGDNDPRPSFIGSKSAPAKVHEDDGGSLTWLLLVPMFGAAMLRRRRV